MYAPVNALSLALLTAALAACSGGAMNETVSEGDEAFVPTEPVPASEPIAAAEQTPSDPEPTATGDSAETYRTAVQRVVLRGWTPPGRANRAAPRIGVVIVQLDDRGRMIAWRWRRRSPDGPFNAAVEQHMGALVDSPRRFPLPDEDSALWHSVLDEGVTVRVADEDA